MDAKIEFGGRRHSLPGNQPASCSVDDYFKASLDTTAWLMSNNDMVPGFVSPHRVESVCSGPGCSAAEPTCCTKASIPLIVRDNAGDSVDPFFTPSFPAITSPAGMIGSARLPIHLQ